LYTLDLSDLLHDEGGATYPLPPELGQLSGLHQMQLRGAKLAGPIPPELSKLKQLELLDLSHNQLTGLLPNELPLLPSLTRINLDNNDLEGPLPASLYGNGTLQVVSIKNNPRLSGDLPQVSFDLKNSVISLDVSNNNLTGSLLPLQLLLPQQSSPSTSSLIYLSIEGELAPLLPSSLLPCLHACSRSSSEQAAQFANEISNDPNIARQPSDARIIKR
jgi:hypothetical protein